MATNCEAKHATYQVTDEDWLCPKCGLGFADKEDKEQFIIEEPDETANEECTLLHALDEIRCSRCDYTSTGERFSKLVAKKKSLVPCTCCKGTGWMKPNKK
jgi:rubredoxin